MSAEDVRELIRRAESGHPVYVRHCDFSGLVVCEGLTLSMNDAQRMLHGLGEGYTYSLHYKGAVCPKDYAVFIAAPNASMGEWRGDSDTAECALIIAVLKAYLAVTFNEVYMKDSLI
ncbi:hypothetical protein SmphiM12_083 [Sinorhizobium phage phiM12]|uniref:Uncharacterized protein n=1 Tax=Sinorhizobium phage phiM12 TaxID=1357423 RepID=S5MPG4_9CAUD|nr:hypothetical protein AB690_gp068 [Sinorhizobium phage phiM12]AGR47715.2 hypothetical protein SmphiM12_083 [Sinorhizobium phage phiM12]